MRQKTDEFETPFKGLANAPKNDQQNGLNYDVANAAQDGLFCPNCGAALEGRKCKLFCHTPGCGYLVTCSEW